MPRYAKFRRFAALVPLLWLAAFPRPAFADYYTHFWEDHPQAAGTFTLVLDFVDYSSSANYGIAGSSVTPPGFDSVSRLGPDLSAVFGLGGGFTAYARLSWVSEKVSTTLQGANASSSASGLADQEIGATWRIWEDDKASSMKYSASADLQLQLEFPGYSDSSADSKQLIHLGEGSLDLSFGGFFTLPLMQDPQEALLAVAGVGYTHRSDGYSSALPWSVQFKWTPVHQGLIAGLALLGDKSLNTDNRTPPTTDVSTAGSVISGAVNPSLITLRATLGYRLESSLELALSFDQSLSGTDAPSGHAIIFGARLTFPQESSRPEGRPQPSPAPTPSQARRPQPPASLTQPPLQAQTRPMQPAPVPVKPKPAPATSLVPQIDLGRYSLEAHIERASEKLNLIKIDKGAGDGVRIGNLFDIFVVNDDGAVTDLIAHCKVKSVNPDASVLSILEKTKTTLIQDGFVARKLKN